MFSSVLGFSSNLIFIGVSVYSYYFMKKILKERSDGPLVRDEKITIILTLIFNTLISFLIYYLGWKNKLPQKAEQVKKYLRKIILILLLIAPMAFGAAFLLLIFRPLHGF